MDALSAYFDRLLFFFSTLTWVDVVDLLLVTIAFYLVLSLLRQSSAAYLIREVVTVIIGLFMITAVLPLPVFDWLVRAFLLAILVATPIVFQAQIRQYLSRVSRTSGIGRVARQSAAEEVIPEIVHAVENMAAARIGALIVLEGNDPLDDVAQSGIAADGRVSSELLQSIFYVGTPLHDGAVIIRTDRVLAAGCVLPLTQQPLPAEKRLGTRHRAAVGISEISDAQVIVVSEETGQIGVAQNGRLDRPLTNAELRDRLQDFFEPPDSAVAAVSLLSILWRVLKYAWSATAFSNARLLLSNLWLLLMSVVLTLVLWSFVLEQTQAIELARVESVPLRVDGLPPNTRLIPSPPTTVSAIIQTTKDVLPTLSTGSFQAVLTIENPEPGLYRLPVQVESSLEQVLVISVEPAALDLTLTPIISRTVPVQVSIPDPQNLSPAYQLIGTPTATDSEVQVLGPEPLVESVELVRADVSVAKATTAISETRTLKAIDSEGQEVTGVVLVPDQTKVNVPIMQRLNASEVSVQATISGSPPEGYQLRAVNVDPTSVTLQGSADQLAQLGSVVNTLPVDISQIKGDLTVQVPLDLPSNIQAVNGSDTPAKVVNVTVRVNSVAGNSTLSRPVKLINASPTLTITVVPKNMNLLLSGPVPVLDEIAADPELVQVLVDATDVQSGQNIKLQPQIVAPAQVQAQLVPPLVQVTAQ